MGKVRPNMSGQNHRGAWAWPILPEKLRGKIITGSDSKARDLRIAAERKKAGK